MPTKRIYSLFDYSGNWCLPYCENGYEVKQIDIKFGTDVRWLEIPKDPVYGVLAAPPCTDFSSSGAQYWNQKDIDGRTLDSLALISAIARFVLTVNPHFWVVENPVGRLKNWFGRPNMYFNPCDFGDPYTKKTCLWGKFNKPKENKVKPEKENWIMKLGGNSERTKELRSTTPMGFAWAFYEANK